MSSQDITRRQTDILIHIARSGSRNEYEVGKALRISRETVHRGLKRLVEKGFLNSKAAGIARTKRTIKRYGLTLLGLAYVLLVERLWDEADELMGRWKEVAPLILPHWGYIKGRVGEEEARRALRAGFEAVLRFRLVDEAGSPIGHTPLVPEGYPGRESLPEGHPLKEMTIYEYYFINGFLRHILLRTPSHLRASWIHALREKPSLRDAARLYLENQMNIHHYLYKRIQDLLHLLQETKGE
jgi:DNA-binding MarR family transcriptional regulator